jgi:hypothetical protein
MKGLFYPRAEFF